MFFAVGARRQDGMKMHETTTVRWVLVVDDDPLHRLLMRDSVEQAGPTNTWVLEAPDGATAQSILAKLPARAVFLMTDRNMPGSIHGDALLEGHLARGGSGVLVTSDARFVGHSPYCIQKPDHMTGWAELGRRIFTGPPTHAWAPLLMCG